MAAGTNWKRPWEDVDFHSGCSKIDNVNNEALLSGFPDTLLDRSHGSQRRVSSPVSRAATPAVLSPSPYRHVGPFNKVSETPRDLYGPHPPALHLRKRQRTDEFQGHGRDSMTVLSAQGESDEPSLRPQGRHSNAPHVIGRNCKLAYGHKALETYATLKENIPRCKTIPIGPLLLRVTSPMAQIKQ